MISKRYPNIETGAVEIVSQRIDQYRKVGYKISRVGGITGMRLIRDVCKASGKILTCDDSWGSQLSATATAHITMSTHPKTFFATYISSYFGNRMLRQRSPCSSNWFYLGQ